MLLGPDGSLVGPVDELRDGSLAWLRTAGIFAPLCDDPEDGARGLAACIGRATLGAHAGKWVGWSHRAAAAFGIGNMIFDAELLRTDPERENVPIPQVGVRPITTDEEAKEAAIAFARYVDG